MGRLFPLLFRYFAFVAAGITVLNWITAARRLEASGKSAALVERGETLMRGMYGPGLAFFLLLGVLQLLGGYPSPLFFLKLPFVSWHSAAAWAGLYGAWAIWLLGIWRTDAASVLVELDMVRPGGLSPAAVRWLVTGVIVLTAVVLPVMAARLPATSLPR